MLADTAKLPPAEDFLDPSVLCLLCLPLLGFLSRLSRPLGREVDLGMFSTGAGYHEPFWANLLLLREMLASHAFSFSRRLSLDGGGSRGDSGGCGLDDRPKKEAIMALDGG